MVLRKLTKYDYLEELELKNETLRTLKAINISIQDLISAARNDVVWQTYMPSESSSHKANQLMHYTGIGKTRAQEIIMAIDELGFILHESEHSIYARRLVVLVFGDPTLFIDCYENLENLSPEALAVVEEIVQDALTKEEKQLIETHLGYMDGIYRPTEECAKIAGITQKRAQRLLSKARVKLRRDCYRPKLEVATCYSHIALADTIADLQWEIFNLQRELDILKTNSPYIELREETGVPLKKLQPKINNVAIMHLEKAGIFTVEQLIKCSDKQLLDSIHRTSDLTKVMTIREELSSQI